MTAGTSRMIAIGASAGGVEAISKLIADLPADFAAPVVVALHSRRPTMLKDIFDRRSKLAVQEAKGAQTLSPGNIYVCPGGMQSYFARGRLVVSDRRLDERFEPSIDLLFRTLAEEYGPRGIAVVMSGMLDDGTEGATALHARGSTMLVQSPDEARHESMPTSVIRHDHPRSILTASGLARKLVDLVH